MANKFDLRQTEYRGTLDQIGNQVTPEGDNLLKAINAQLTPLLRMSAAASPSLVVSVGGGDLTDAETNRRRAIPHVGTAYVQFTSGTVTFPAASGGNIVCSPGVNTVLTIASGNYAAVLIYLDGTGGLNALPGADSAVLNTAITNLPPSPDETLPLGFIVVQNVAGVIQNITQANIAQFGTGTGGGGSGNVTAVETALRDYNNFAGTKYLDPNIFRQAKATKVDGASTGSFDLVKNAFKFTSIGNTFVSTNLANAEFLAEGVDITDAHLYVHWLLNFIDASATYEMSRDGGTNWTTMTMARVGSASNAFRGYKVFPTESTQQNLDSVAATGAGSALNATTQQQLSSKLVMTSTGVVTSIDMNLNYGGAGVGTVTARIVRDSAGSPSTAVGDILSESNAKTISTASLGGTGNITVNFDMPDVVLTAGTYHIVLLTDAAYKAGTLDLSWRSAAGTDGANYNGTAWTAGQASKAHTAKGRYHDLRVRITAGTALTYLEGMGVYFPSDDGLVRPNGTKYVQRFYFSGDANQTEFTLNWVPDPDLLDILDPYRGQVYAIEPGVAKISGQTVTFAPDTFNYPGESIVLIFRQVKGIAIDNSDSNAAAISTHTQNLLDVGDQASDLEYVTIPTMAVANTAITGRSAMPDLSQDMNARFAVNRLTVQQLYLLQGEQDTANGKPVRGTSNDRLNQMRFVGNWQQFATNLGPVVVGNDQDDYCEITFYGTGLNMLTLSNGISRDVRATVDGGSEGANLFPATTNAIIATRNYATNEVYPVSTGLALGIHTIRLRNASAAQTFPIYGFEVLNEQSTAVIKVQPGSQFVRGSKRTLASQQSFAYNTTFESGTLGTRGGRVIIYQKLDGSIAKAVQPTDAAQANLTSASHANEEIARIYHWREFGANRADDFSTLTTVSDRAFTVNDGSTTLIGNDVLTTGSATLEGLRATGAGAFLTVNFVGTGLDIHTEDNDANARVTDIFVDGVSTGSISTPISQSARLIKIVSGLPYGTHTVRFLRNTLDTIFIRNFVVYQPKTPTLPANAKLLAAYNIMADYTANATAGVDRIATGVLRKASVREFIYTGTGWTIATAVTDNPAGYGVASNTNGARMQYTFYGTGFELRFSAQTNRSNNISVALNGLAATTANYPSLVSSVYGTGVTFAAGVLDQNDAATTNGSGVSIRGLPLATYTVTFTNNTANFMDIGALDVITPIHSHKDNLYTEAQNTLSVGSQGIEDFRKISSLEQLTKAKAWAQAIGVASSPTTTSTAFVPMPDMSVTIKVTTGNKLRISYASAVQTTSNATNTQAYINGAAVGVSKQSGSSTTLSEVSDSFLVPVAPGTYKVDVYWQIAAGTATATGLQRNLTVEEV